MRALKRFLQRLVIFGLGIFSAWFIVFVVFEFADRRLPWFLALAATYGATAYIILPRVVRMGLKVLQHKRVPSYTITGDGLPGDPVNLVLVGTLEQLRAAFATAGWSTADPLGLTSSWRMARAFVLNSPYPTAPFSTLYLFGRGQDIGFQKAIDGSPRKRHHIRFLGLGYCACRYHMGHAEILVKHRSAFAERQRLLDRSWDQGYRFLANPTYIPDYARDRFRYQRRAGFYHFRLAE